eukprot:c20088_g1_i1 orf=568-1821(-)
MVVVSFPTRFVLSGDNQVYAFAENSLKWVGCFLESRYHEGAAFQVGSSTHPEISSAVTLRHVLTSGARAELGIFDSEFPVLSIRQEEISSAEESERDFYFELVLLDDENSGGGSGSGSGGRRATLRVHRTAPNSTHIDESFYIIRVENMENGRNATSLESLLMNHKLFKSKSSPSLLLPASSSSTDNRNIGEAILFFIRNLLVRNRDIETGQVIQPTIFTVHEWVALNRTWTEIIYDMDKAIVEDTEIFAAATYRFDNSNYDQDTIIRPTLTFSETIETSFSRSFTWGLEQRIQVTARIPFVKELEVEFKATQTWDSTEGNSVSTTVESSVQVEVIVPAFRKTVVYVVGSRGKVTLPFRYVETSSYEDGTRVQRTLHDGVCRSVSSVEMQWRAEYYDAFDTKIDVDFTSSGYFPSLD